MAVIPFELFTELVMVVSGALFYVGIGAIVVVVIDALIILWMRL